MAAAHLLLLLLLAAVAGSEDLQLLPPGKLEKFVDELPDIPRLRGFAVDAGGNVVAGNLTIGMYDTLWKFHRDLAPSRVFAYGTSEREATVPGPTVESLQMVPTVIEWANHLPSRHFLPWDPTVRSAAPAAGVPAVVHLHGGVQPPSSDGSPLAWYTAALAATGPHFSSAVFHYPNRQPPGNLWYHDHAMGLTRVNILAGLFGAYRIVGGDDERRLGLPSGPEFDRHIVLFDRTFEAGGAIYMNRTGNNPSIHPQWQPEYFGPVIIANGKAWPFLQVRRRRYRFRILNASNARFFRLSLSNGLRFVHVSSDSLYLPAPAASAKFLLGPSEFADVIVDFSESPTETAVLLNDAAYPFPSGDSPDDDSGKVMKFVIAREREQDSSVIPAKLIPYIPKQDARSVAETRYITMYEYESATGEPTHLYLNGKSFMDAVTEKPKEGTDEMWVVINLTDDNHPLHVHLAVFTVIEQRRLVGAEKFKSCMMAANNATSCGLQEHAVGRRSPVPPHERGWKNVFKVRPGFVTTMLVRFRPLTAASPRFPFDVTEAPGYAYHCHILDHEDNEMMRPYQIIR